MYKVIFRQTFRKQKQMKKIFIPALTIFLRGSMSVAALTTSVQKPANDQQVDLYFDAKAQVIPHPDKATTGGEDANFVSRYVLGVADGVGGWNLSGVDPSKYSRALVGGALESAEDGEVDPLTVMEAGADKANGILGSATLCVVSLYDGKFHSANIGDSGYMIFRNNELLYRSKEQQHDFNFPYQLGEGSGDTPAHAQLKKHEAKENDLLIVGSDGLFDNVFDETIEDMVKIHRNVDELADRLAKLAASNGANMTFSSPFSVAARRYNYNFLGGKQDDVTVVVARVKAEQSRNNNNNNNNNNQKVVAKQRPGSSQRRTYATQALSLDDGTTQTALLSNYVALALASVGLVGGVLYGWRQVVNDERRMRDE
mmetsp:Transcript_3286/g.5274  ORF Transcript_3286/g.5274 Transcript_3286/m.5274 type:complete len:370 (-) Transcript_3286:51-1160(-)